MADSTGGAQDQYLSGSSGSSGAGSGDTAGGGSGSGGAGGSSSSSPTTATTDAGTRPGATGGLDNSPANGGFVAASTESPASGAADTPSPAGTPGITFELHLTCSWKDGTHLGTYWASQADYLVRLLSINYKVENTGTGKALNVRVTEATADNGVNVATSPLPNLGDIDPGKWTIFTLKWNVPDDVTHYVTTLKLCADCDQYKGDNNLIDDGGRSNDPGSGTGAGASAGTVTGPVMRDPGAGFYASSLPNTGFNFIAAFIMVAGGALIITLVSVPTVNFIRLSRRK